ncbi:MAG: tetratricopeptide repeat protein [Deltaproteobacteria bacterium]|nr:tetratricopeptide repeat protein [Deltaproteobacteria bacterium]
MKKRFRISKLFMPGMTIRRHACRFETACRWYCIRVFPMALFVLLVVFAGCAGRGIISSPPPPKPEAALLAAQRQKPAGSYYDYMMAEISLKKGDTKKAVHFLEDAVKKDPDSLRIKKELSVLYVQQDRKKDALFLAEDILDKEPDDVDALIIAGSIRQSMGDSPAAEKAYEKVIRIDPGRKNIYVVLGRLYISKGDFDLAVDLFSGMVKRFADSYTGYYYLGKAYAGKKELKKGEASFLKALEIEPSLMEPRVELIRLYKKTGEIKSERDQYEAVLKAYPDNDVAAVDLGLLYMKTGKKDKAASIFDALGEKSISDARVIDIVLKNLIAPKRFDDALTVLTGMEPGAPGSDDINYLFGVTFYIKDDFDKALPRLLSVEDGSRFYIDAVLHAATIYDSSNRIDAAIALLDSAFSVAGEEDKVRLSGFLAAFYEKKKDYDMAETVLKKGLAIDPENPDLYYSLGIVLDKKGDPGAAVKEMETVIRLAPDHADALNYLGYTYADKGEHLDKAEALVKKALSLKPDNGYILDSIGWVYFKKGDFENALTYMIKAVEKVPDDAIILEHLGDVYVALNQADKALETYERALSRKKDADTEGLEKKIEALKKGGE